MPKSPTAALPSPTRVRNGKRLRADAPTPESKPGSSTGASAQSAGALRWTDPKSKGTAEILVGDCRSRLPTIPEVRAGTVDLIFADPPFNWNRAYDKWDDAMTEAEYLAFTYEWLSLCIGALRPGGALWINIPDDWAAEIVCFLKGRLPQKPPSPMMLENWCIWHYRFGQNATERFINSKVHALYFVKPGRKHTWNASEILEESDRASIYFDPRTQSKKDGMPPGMRVPMDVWYGKFWGRVQGNNKERRNYHDNQLPEVYLERVLRACTNPGDLVIDPFLGSGTTGVLAAALGRRFIGCEFSPDNAKNALARIQHGPIRLGAATGISTAIFKSRKVGKKTAARLANKD